MKQQDKICVNVTMASYLLKALKVEREVMAEKLLDFDIEIEELEKSIQLPVPILDKKETEFALTANRVVTTISKHSGLNQVELMKVIATDLNIDLRNKLVKKELKSRLYSHIYSLKKKALIVATYVQETASYVYFPATTSTPS